MRGSSARRDRRGSGPSDWVTPPGRVGPGVNPEAHEGDRTAAVFRGWPWASILDLYEDDIFPFTRQPEDYPLPVPAGLTGVEYLEIVREALPLAIDAVRPDLVAYNAGSDPFV